MVLFMDGSCGVTSDSDWCDDWGDDFLDDWGNYWGDDWGMVLFMDGSCGVTSDSDWCCHSSNSHSSNTSSVTKTSSVTSQEGGIGHGETDEEKGNSDLVHGCR